MKNFDVDVKIISKLNEPKRFKIYVNELLHVSFDLKELIGFKSYIDGYGKDANYIIRFYVLSANITCKYDTFEKFELMLKKINEKI